MEKSRASEQAVGIAGASKCGCDNDGKLLLTKEPELLSNDNDVAAKFRSVIAISKATLAVAVTCGTQLPIK